MGLDSSLLLNKLLGYYSARWWRQRVTLAVADQQVHDWLGRERQLVFISPRPYEYIFGRQTGWNRGQLSSRQKRKILLVFAVAIM